MKSVWLGLLTIAGNNFIDGFFLVLLLEKHLDLNKKGKRVLRWFVLLWYSAILSMICFLLQSGFQKNAFPNAFIYEILYNITYFIMIFLMPGWLNRKQIFKYFFCYALNRMWIAVMSCGIYGACIALRRDGEILFYTDSVEKLPVCLCINVIYAILSYAGYRILNVFIRGYRRESKVQNGLAIGFIIITTLSEGPVYYSIAFSIVEGVAAYVLMYLWLFTEAALFFIVATYQNRVLERESAFIRRRRKEDEAYYMQLEKNQLAIRKMRHDMLDYIQTLQRLSGDEVKRRELLEELEGRLGE